MKKSILLLLLLLSCSANDMMAQTKINKTYYIDLLSQGEYKRVYQEVSALQKKPYGKCCFTDFMLAKSLCLSGMNKQAENRFKNMLVNYKLPKATIDYLKQEQVTCSTNTGTVNLQTTNNIIVFPSVRSSVTGKLGKVFDCYQSYQPVRVLREISEEETTARIFPIDDTTAALTKIQSIIPKNCKAEISNRFILVTLKNNPLPKTTIKEISDELNQTLLFYASHYHLSLPDKIFTVYMMPNNTELRKIANAIHGIEIPKENYGYSTLSDLSLAGISNFIRIGTLKHELFHLMVRADIGDVPAWLDEGIATLYEESQWKNDKLVGNKKFWRQQTLIDAYSESQLVTKIPDLERLINESWQEFEGGENGDICKTSINYAFSKHLILFLEQKQLLVPMLEAFKNRRPEDENGIMPSNSEIVEEVLKTSIYEIEKEFNEWLKENYFKDTDAYYYNSHNYGHLVKLRENLHEAKRIAAQNKEEIPGKLNISYWITVTENRLSKATESFDTEMKQLYIESKGNDPDYFKWNDILEKFRKRIVYIDEELKDVLEQYR